MTRNDKVVWLTKGLITGVTLLASSVALANEDRVRLADTVITASGFEQKITDAPASISVISNEDLQQKGVRTFSWTNLYC